MKTWISRKMTPAMLGLAILGTVTVAHATHVVCAVFYMDANYGGGIFTVENAQNVPDLGAYNYRDPGSSAVNVPYHDRFSSLRMFDGCFCATYRDVNYGGTPGYWANNQDVPNLGFVTPGYNDNISSVFCG